jgi:hypothetical protein
VRRGQREIEIVGRDLSGEPLYICAAAVKLLLRSARSADAGPVPSTGPVVQAPSTSSASSEAAASLAPGRGLPVPGMVIVLRGLGLAGQALYSFSTRKCPEIIVSPPGRIDVVATPIGNLGDFRPRPRALAAADVIAPRTPATRRAC